jgi:hypothetical protein
MSEDYGKNIGGKAGAADASPPDAAFSDAPSPDTPSSSGAESTGASSPGAGGELESWIGWMQQVVLFVVALGSLASAEGRLALSDVKRVFVASIMLIPLMMLMWLSLGVWLSWLVYSWSGSAGYAFFAFFVLQAAMSWYLRKMIKTYRSTLSLPKTRQYVHELLEDIKRGSSRSDS